MEKEAMSSFVGISTLCQIGSFNTAILAYTVEDLYSYDTRFAAPCPSCALSNSINVLRGIHLCTQQIMERHDAE
jgi:hypothetical protein